MKRNAVTFIFSLLVTVAFAQSNYGTDHFGIGEYQLAKIWFEQHLNQSPAESYYYLGEIAWKEGYSDKARDYFEKGIATDPLYMFNLIGKGKTMLKASQKEATTLFTTALKKNKKNVPMNLAVALAYEENGLADLAAQKMAVVQKIGKKSAIYYIYLGDQALAGTSDGKLGEASSKYEQAMYFDPGNTVASIKYAQVYNNINPTLAIEVLKKVITAHPDYLVAYRDLATSYSKNGVYPLAIENFKTYFAAGTYNVEEITRFASVYYFTDQFEESMKLINEGLQKEPNQFVLNRLRMYNASKSKDTENGLSYAKAFFNLRTDNGNNKGNEIKFIYQDYLAYATILADSGYYDMALDQYQRVLDSDEEKVDKASVYKEIATCYNKMKDFPKAGEAFQKYIDLIGIDYVESSAFFQLGMAYYQAGSALRSDSSETGKALLTEYITKSDSAFAITCRLSPESYVGYMWRGNVNVLLDPESTDGLAKPHYEAAVDVILKKVQDEGSMSNGYKKQLITAYNYLGYYYYLKEDKENSILYWNKILELDPTNKNAKMVLDAYKAEEAEAKKK